nr:immunoglobulin heavy chain junction region [Macaca mulatta]MOW23542.1 immunoglobulin heavy chain junction region [Macaca mulatta]MOW24744.1 immunoglobulin heavy chain junction region [Macaca mulatta]MOW25713.1 immunoglobulin heavy chain junction region [Macaca mulatta]MOW26478.1 immunoglobulin heavy chain junction region [Macaca mulatta]
CSRWNHGSFDIW